MAGAHPAHGFARAHHAADDVDGEHALQARGGHLVDPRRDVDHAGVVHQAGEPAELGVDGVEHRQHLVLLRHVGLHRDGGAAGGADVAHHLVGGERVGGVVDGDRPAARAASLAVAAPMPRLPPVTRITCSTCCLLFGGRLRYGPIRTKRPIAGPETPCRTRSTTSWRRKARGPTSAMSASCAWRAKRAPVRVRPMDLGKVFPVSGGLPLAKRAPQRQAYRLVELQRFRDHLKLPLNLQPRFFPVSGDAPRA
jgi:hypothetical protein